MGLISCFTRFTGEPGRLAGATTKRDLYFVFFWGGGCVRGLEKGLMNGGEYDDNMVKYISCEKIRA